MTIEFVPNEGAKLPPLKDGHFLVEDCDGDIWYITFDDFGEPVCGACFGGPEEHSAYIEFFVEDDAAAIQKYAPFTHYSGAVMIRGVC